ncbi:LOB domain-containing protein 36-like [Impatiens glandulifera]|uniref:LOB domain-containing protein 36-like n=1 Tax=Impatiens glandulifera TaxID=253017 RepID=UPI001FB061DE|nr:LOB domain-containing protein 36-like [Impatiens glandulifera]
MEPSSNLPPCAACKFFRRKCRDCIFAPYFPSDNSLKFENVHSVYGASNVSKFLKGLNPCQRERAANTLAYEAEQRLRDPMLGVVGLVYQHEMEQAQKIEHLQALRMELATYIGPRAMWPMGTNQSPSQPSQASSSSSNMNQMIHIPNSVNQQLAIQEPYSQHQHQSSAVGFNLNPSPSQHQHHHHHHLQQLQLQLHDHHSSPSQALSPFEGDHQHPNSTQQP